MKKILIIVSSLDRTGPGFVVESLVKTWTRMNQADICIIAISDSEEFIQLADNISIYYLHQPHGKVPSQTINMIKEIVEQFEPDVVMSHGLRADIVNSKIKLKKVIQMATSHNNPFEDYTQQFGLRGMAMAFLQMYTFNKLDLVITLNPKLQMIHKLFLFKPKVNLIPNGSEKITVNRYDISNDIRFGCVATFNARKNQKQILNQFMNIDDSKITLWGSGDLHEQLRKKYTKENIIFAGQSNNKSEMYNSFDVLISSSKSEGLPLSVIEAISAGKPLILSKIPAHEFITRDMDQRYFRLFSDDQGLADAIEYFKNNRNIILDASFYFEKFFDSRFSMEQIATNYIKVVEKIR